MRITAKGQVTIPQRIREELGLHPHTEVEFTIEQGAAVMRRTPAPTIGELTVQRLKQGLNLTRSGTEILALLRDELSELEAK